MRTLPAAWTAAASAAAAAGAHRARVLVRLEVNDAGDGVWLSHAKPSQDAAGLQAWQSAGAFAAATEFGPYGLLLEIPQLGSLHDLATISALSASLSGLSVSNEVSAEVLADFGVDRLSEIRLIAGHSFRARELRVVALYAGMAWADRLEWSLVVRELEDWDELVARFNASERASGAGGEYINAKVSVSDHPYRAPENEQSPKPIMIGSGSVPLLPLRRHIVVTDREGRAASGGYVSPIKPAQGAPWTSGDALTFGAGTATVASVAGSDDTDTVLSLDSPGLPRDPLHGELDLSTFEEGYHVVGAPASGTMDYLAADPGFTHSIGTVSHLPPGGRDVLPLPAYCGTPVDNADGTVTLDKMPRSGGRLSQAWLDGTAGSGVAASTAFAELCTKLGTSCTTESGAGTLLLQGARAEWVSAVELLRVLEVSSRSRIFWNGSELRMRKRKTAAEIGTAYDWTVDRDDVAGAWPKIREIPVQYQLRGLTGRWALRPGRDRSDSNAYAGQRVKGSGGQFRDRLFWLDFVRDDATGEELVDFWFELLGPMSSGRWPRYISGLSLGWEYMAIEPEDIVRIERVDPSGVALDGLAAGNSTRWRVVSPIISWPRGGAPGSVVVDLLEVHS